jgi:hypothetical protein
MGTEVDRRAPYATRVPFDAMVEVGGALGPSFEAKAVNLSSDGMHLRTAYLPEVGQPVSCNFDVAEVGMILVSGIVIWQEKSGEGGEFGIRFTNIDPESAEHLKSLLAQARGQGPKAGARVRLHIDGLAAPMRGRVRGAETAGMTACSDLNFLQLGKPLDVEDASSGARRPASIGGVQLEIDPETQVPQLIVSMRYADAQDAPAAAEDAAGATDNTSRAEESSEPNANAARANEEPAQAVPPPAPESTEIEEESAKMKSAWAKKAQNVGPALNAWAKKTKDRLNEILKKRREAPTDDVAVKGRRTTSPPPAGALHASGRRVVRADMDEAPAAPEKRRLKLTKRHAAVAGAVGVASILAIVALRKPAEKPLVSAPPNETTAPEGAMAQTNPAAPPPQQQPGATTPSNAQPGSLPIANGNEPTMDDEKGGKGKKGKVPPFTNGAVTHGNVLRIKMDGAIDKIQGAAQPTGFTVVIPNRKSEEAAAPLAARDSRIAGINVSNNPSGAELTVNFKDGVPNYMVRAKGSYLEIVLAQGGGGTPNNNEGAPTKTAKKGHGKHGKH